MVNHQKTEQAWNSEPGKHPNMKYEKPPEQTQPVTNEKTEREIVDSEQQPNEDLTEESVDEGKKIVMMKGTAAKTKKMKIKTRSPSRNQTMKIVMMMTNHDQNVL